jgi:hypothetical protein
MQEYQNSCSCPRLQGSFERSWALIPALPLPARLAALAKRKTAALERMREREAAAAVAVGRNRRKRRRAAGEGRRGGRRRGELQEWKKKKKKKKKKGGICEKEDIKKAGKRLHKKKNKREIEKKAFAKML